MPDRRDPSPAARSAPAPRPTDQPAPADGDGDGDGVAVRAGVHDADIGGEIVLLHPDDGAYFALNETGAHLWRQLGPEATPRADAIRRATDTLTARWPVDGDQATADLRELLDELIDRGLVDVAP